MKNKTALMLWYHGPNKKMVESVAEELPKLGMQPLLFNHLEVKDVYKLLKKLRPSVVTVPHNVDAVGFLLTSYARLNGIPTLIMHEGGTEVADCFPNSKRMTLNLPDFPYSKKDIPLLFIFKLLKLIQGNSYVAHSYSDNIALLSVTAAKYVKGLGVKTPITITGQPRFDTIFKEKYDSIHIRKSLNIPDKPVILLLTSILAVDGIIDSNDYDIMIKEVLKILSDYGHEVIIKIHPRESFDKYNTAFPKNLIFNDHLYELIFISDIVVTVPSTTTLEALCFKKNVFSLDFFSIKCISEIYEPVVSCKNIEELKSNLNRIFSDKKNDINLKMLEPYIFKSDGKSSRRMAELMLEISQ